MNSLTSKRILGLTFRQYKEQCFVYIWRRGEQCLYVGRSSRGLTRLLNEHHVIDKLERVLDTDVIEMYPCNSWELGPLEKQLIKSEKPKYNKPTGFEQKWISKVVDK